METLVPETLKYLINGQPLSFAKAHYASESGFSNTKDAQLIWRITLANQHNERPPLKENLEVFFQFYFLDAPRYKPRKDPEAKKQHKLTPTAFELMKFVSEMATGILWTDTRLIVRSTVEKYYSQEPRTEITIIRLGD